MIVGDGPDRARLEALARNLGVADAVTFTGVVSRENLPAHFAAGDVFAMPNRARWCGLDDEALGAVFLQAAAVGRAVVAGDAGGAGEAIVDGVTGHLTDGHDHQALADMLVRLLADPAYASRLGSAGARRIQNDYTWQRMANRLHDLLQELAGARRP
jgi:phosphatidylinositol alpha-1,6-mannosyltransferase